MPSNNEYFNSRDFLRILQEFEENELKGVPTIISSEDYTDIAEYYYDNGNEDRAEYVINIATQLYPGAIAPLLLIARIELIDRHNPERAEQIAERIEDKTDPEYHYFKAELLLIRGQVSNANKYLNEHYAERDDEDKDYFAIDVGTLFMDYDEYSLASMWAARVKDTSIEEYLRLAGRLATEDGNFKKGISFYKKLLDIDPYSLEDWIALASAQFLNFDMEGAINSCEFALAIDPNNATAIINKAEALYNIGNYEEAVRFFYRYLEQIPDSINILLQVGQALIMLERYDEAIEHLRKAKELVSIYSYERADILRNLAWALCQTEHPEEGLAELDLLSDKDNDYWETKFYRGVMLNCADRHEEAEPYFIAAIKDANCNPTLAATIATMFYDNGDIDFAYKLYTLIFSRFKRYHNGHAYYAACCYKLNKEEEFLKQLKLAVKHEPDIAKKVLSIIFPSRLAPAKYYQYYISHKKE